MQAFAEEVVDGEADESDENKDRRDDGCGDEYGGHCDCGGDER